MAIRFDDSTLYTIPFQDFTVGSSVGPWDLMTIKGTTFGRTELAEIHIGEKSSNTAANQQIDIYILRGTASSSLGGAAITPINAKGWSAAPVSGAVVNGPSSAVASTAGAVLLYADVTDHSGRFDFPRLDFANEEYVMDVGQVFTIRVSQPAASIVLSGTVSIRERPLRG